MLTDDFFIGTQLYHQKLTELCKPIGEYLGGITQVMYVNLDKQGRIFSIYTDPKWVERFLEEQYYKIDPLIVHPNNIQNGFSFDDASTHQEFKDVLLYDAVTKFNWCNSFAYVEKGGAGDYFAFDFGTSKDNSKLINQLINGTQIVRKFIRNLNKQLMAITQNLQETRMDFAALKGDEFYTQKGLIFNEKRENQEKIQLLIDLGLLNRADLDSLAKVSLSPQETNCLRSYLASRSLKEVARELDLALSTVATYVENIKGKLDCHYKNELFEKGEILESMGRI